MIPDELLFQMPLLLFSGITLNSLLWILSLSLVLFFILRYFLSRKNTPRILLSRFPEGDDPDFESRLSLCLRERITRIYRPEKTLAHTTREIEHYASNHPYFPLLREIETTLYRSESLSEDRKVEILKSIKI